MNKSIEKWKQQAWYKFCSTKVTRLICVFNEVYLIYMMYESRWKLSPKWILHEPQLPDLKLRVKSLRDMSNLINYEHFGKENLSFFIRFDVSYRICLMHVFVKTEREFSQHFLLMKNVLENINLHASQLWCMLLLYLIYNSIIFWSFATLIRSENMLWYFWEVVVVGEKDTKLEGKREEERELEVRKLKDSWKVLKRESQWELFLELLSQKKVWMKVNAYRESFNFFASSLSAFLSSFFLFPYFLPSFNSWRIKGKDKEIAFFRKLF